MAKPVYIFSGFLDSGKTRAIKETLLDPRFNEGEKTLIVSFEMGDEEYDSEFLKKTNSVLVEMDFKDWSLDLTSKLEKEHNPDRIFLELNGMEDDNMLYETGFCEEWEIAQTLTTVDASTFRLYMNNMRQFMFNHLVNAEVAIVNRSDNEDLRSLRNNIKSINCSVEIIFEDSEGNVTNKLKDMLFDVSKPIEVSDTDYGLWYMDVVDNPMNYRGAEVSVNAFLFEVIPEEKNLGIFGRKAMVCCADDVQPIAFPAFYNQVDELEVNAYYKIHGQVMVMADEQDRPACVIEADRIERIDAANDELVFFN